MWCGHCRSWDPLGAETLAAAVTSPAGSVAYLAVYPGNGWSRTDDAPAGSRTVGERVLLRVVR